MNAFCRKILSFIGRILIRIFWLIKLFYISINLTVEVNRNDRFEKVDVAVDYTEFFLLLLAHCLGESG